MGYGLFFFLFFFVLLFFQFLKFSASVCFLICVLRFALLLLYNVFFFVCNMRGCSPTRKGSLLNNLYTQLVKSTEMNCLL